MPLDRLSLSTVAITPFFNSLKLSGGDRVYLEASRTRLSHHQLARHVCIKTLFTKIHLSEGGARPNKLRCHFLVRMGQYERELIDIPIRDENDRPLWLTHVAHETRAIDVVALPLDYDSLKTKITLLPVNELAPGKIAIMIGMDVRLVWGSIC